MLIGWIMGTHGIHIHFFNEQGILNAEFLIGGTPAIGVKRMTVYAFHHQFRTIQINTVAWTKVNGTESDADRCPV